MLHRQALGVAIEVVSHVTILELGRSTPCVEWAVGDLLEHMVYGNRVVVAGVGGVDPVPIDPEMIRADPVGSYVASAEAAAAAFEQDGAPRAVFRLPFGEVSGALFVQMRVNDQLAHAWDLARALHLPTDLAPELYESALPLARERIEQLGRNPLLFAAEQEPPHGATAADRLAAFLGRAV